MLRRRHKKVKKGDGFVKFLNNVLNSRQESSPNNNNPIPLCHSNDDFFSVDEDIEKWLKKNLDEDYRLLYHDCCIDPKTVKQSLLDGSEEGYGHLGIVTNGWLKLGFKRIPVAIKKVKLDVSKGKKSFSIKVGNSNTPTPTEILHQVNLMNEVGEHKNTLECYGCWFLKNHCYIVLEYCEQYDLCFYLKKFHDHISDLKKIEILIQIAEGCLFLNNKGLIHRRLSTVSMVMGNDNLIKISDFQDAKEISFCTTESNLAVRGIPQYSAPEMVGEIECGKNPIAIDVYSFGIIAWEIWTGKIPFFKIKNLIDIHKKKIRPDLKLLENAPKMFCELAEKCWKHDPNNRIQDFIVIKETLEQVKIQMMEAENQLVNVEGVDDDVFVDHEDNVIKYLNVEERKIYNRCKIDRKNVKMSKIINKRPTAVTKKAKLKVGFKHIPVAVKIMDINELDNTRKMVIHEASIMNECEHNNILQCYGIWFDEISDIHVDSKVGKKCPTANLVLELCDQSMYSQIQDLSGISKMNILLQIAKGMVYLHSKNIVHRNLNTSNLLIYYPDGEEGADDPIVKISDFKVAKYVKDLLHHDEFVGSPAYVPPELCGFGDMLSPKLIDIYAFGIIIWEVWKGEIYQLPEVGTEISDDVLKDYGGIINWIAVVQYCHLHKIRPDTKALERCPPSLISLMENCWSPKQSKRPIEFSEVQTRLVDIKNEINHNEEKRLIKSTIFEGVGQEDERIIEQCLIDQRFVEVGKLIGTGSKGSVTDGSFHLGFERIPVALKSIVVKDLSDSSGILHEVKMMHECEHVNVLKCYGIYFQNSNTVSVVTELCQQGDLYHFIQKHKAVGQLTDLVKISILIQIAKGMCYLHNSRKIVHRDLKTLNILIGDDRKLKISDFDTAKHSYSAGFTVCGTPEYIAPEMFGFVKNPERFEKHLCDIYSFGIIMYEVWTTRLPFNELRLIHKPAQMINEIHRKGLRPDLNNVYNVPYGVKELMAQCWRHNPSERPVSFTVILEELTKIKDRVKGVIL